MFIEKYICSKEDTSEQIRILLTTKFEIDEEYSNDLKEKVLDVHLKEYGDNIYSFIETPYVDKVYRDSYYHYFSSKLHKYDRNCIRVSFFEGEITMADFRNQEGIEALQKKFLGFIVIRPTEPKIIGRSVLSPKIKKERDIAICTVNVSTTVDCIKFHVEGFPHSSQDTETITCAETTIWALMEYFSHKYPEYKPVLPANITETLSLVSSERQIPSTGLDIQQISFALKAFGFGTRIYSAKEFRREFYKLLSCYVESGIPIVIAIENDEEKRIGHAVLCVGHKKIEHNQVENLVEEIIRDETARIDLLKREISIYDYDNLNKEFVFVDDNMPVFQKALLAEPAKYYEDPDWGKCKITHFVVPLYPKNYLEAYEAKNFIQNFLSKKFLPIPDNTKLFVRTFLASGRSYKNAIALDPDISEDIRTLICETAMPKFIWVTELATKDLIKIEKAEGLVILDATEARVTHLKPLLLAAYENSVLYYDSENKVFAKNNIPLSRFGTYKNNLIRF